MGVDRAPLVTLPKTLEGARVWIATDSYMVYRRDVHIWILFHQKFLYLFLVVVVYMFWRTSHLWQAPKTNLTDDFYYFAHNVDAL